MTEPASEILQDIRGEQERWRWQESAAAWDRWAERMADPADRINRPMLEALDAAPGSRVLDLAAGVGEPSLTIAEALGNDGLVVACDLVPGMLSALARRARQRVHKPAAVAADMLRLPFASGTFDHIACRFGLMFVPDVGAALAEMRRVLKPGGSAVLAVWGPMTENCLFHRIDQAFNDTLGVDADDMLRTLFRFAEPWALLRLAENSGFQNGECRTLRSRQTASTAHPFWRPTLDMGFAARLAGLDTASRAELEARISDGFIGGADADGRIVVQICVHLLRIFA